MNMEDTVVMSPDEVERMIRTHRARGEKTVPPDRSQGTRFDEMLIPEWRDGEES